MIFNENICFYSFVYPLAKKPRLEIRSRNVDPVSQAIRQRKTDREKKFVEETFSCTWSPFESQFNSKMEAEVAEIASTNSWGMVYEVSLQC